MILFTPAVGVAPGTTTMQLDGCPPDSVRRYTMPPVVQESAGPWAGAWDPPGAPTLYNPYADAAKLRGLRGLGLVAPRWGLVLFAGLSVFAVMLLLLRRKRR